MSDDNKKFSDELDDLLGDAKEGVKRAAEKAEEFAREAREKGSEFAKEAKGKAKEFSDEASEAFDKVSGDNKKVLAGVLAILLGGFGIHKFVLGYTQEGIILLVITILLSIFSFGLLSFLVWVFTVIEGIIYLTKSDDDFYNTYQVGKKPWF